MPKSKRSAKPLCAVHTMGMTDDQRARLRSAIAGGEVEITDRLSLLETKDAGAGAEAGGEAEGDASPAGQDSESAAEEEVPTCVRSFPVGARNCRPILRHPTRANWVVVGEDADVCAGHTVPVARIWDVETGRCTQTIRSCTGSAGFMAIRPDGTQVAVATLHGTVRFCVWDLSTGACAWRGLELHRSTVVGMTWNNAGTSLATIDFEGRLCLWDATTGKGRIADASWTRKGTGPRALVSHPSEPWFAKTHGHEIHVHAWDTGARTAVLAGHENLVRSLTTTATHLVSGGWDRTVRVWDWSSAACLRVLDGFAIGIGACALDWLSDTLVVVDMTGVVTVWDTYQDDPIRWSRHAALPGRTHGDGSVAVLEDTRVVCGCTEDSLSLSVWTA